MDNREIVACAVDVDTGKVTWMKYNESWRQGKADFMEDYYIQRALESMKD